ncbi:MAG TPA: ABC transporter ATP-binding protein [Acidimicrobiales bacterium]|nr:ABC transporter ATP-binding protein [Acidimicrobiales bacterium]
MAAVEVQDLVVRYGDLVAVNCLSFTAEAGAVTAVLGPNGAGKSSTIEVLEGFRAPDRGSVRVLGLDPVSQHGALVAEMGVMLQQGGVYPGIRAGEAAALFCAYYGHRRRADELLAAVGLTERARSPWRQLSGGEQQRLSLGLALAGRPSVAFLDEPTASVDVAGRQRVRSLMRSLSDDGCCVVLTTHELEEAERMADSVLIIDRGRLVASGRPGELVRSIRTEEIRFGAPSRLDVAGLGASLGALVREDGPGEYVVEAPPDPATIAELTAWLAARDIPLADLRAGRKRLEDVYLALTGRDPAAVETTGALDAVGGRRRGRRRRSEPR